MEIRVQNDGYIWIMDNDSSILTKIHFENTQERDDFLLKMLKDLGRVPY